MAVGKATSTTHFGAFVELEKGVEGLVHVSKMSNGYVEHSGRVVSRGQQVEVTILSIDTERQRVELDMREAQAVDEPQTPVALNEGDDEMWVCRRPPAASYRSGLHMRPAALIVRYLSLYPQDIPNVPDIP